MPPLDPDCPASHMTMRQHVATQIASGVIVRPPQFYVGEVETEKELTRWAKDVWRVTDALLKHA